MHLHDNEHAPSQPACSTYMPPCLHELAPCAPQQASSTSLLLPRLYVPPTGTST